MERECWVGCFCLSFFFFFFFLGLTGGLTRAYAWSFLGSGWKKMRSCINEGFGGLGVDGWV